jgi:hypothetical protein
MLVDWENIAFDFFITRVPYPPGSIEGKQKGNNQLRLSPYLHICHIIPHVLVPTIAHYVSCGFMLIAFVTWIF